MCDELYSSDEPPAIRKPSTVRLLAPKNRIPGIETDPSAGTASTRVIAACLTDHCNDEPVPPPVTQIVLPLLAELATAAFSAEMPLTETLHVGDGVTDGDGDGVTDGDGVAD